jgi:hypothetical protein
MSKKLNAGLNAVVEPGVKTATLSCPAPGAHSRAGYSYPDAYKPEFRFSSERSFDTARQRKRCALTWRRIGKHKVRVHDPLTVVLCHWRLPVTASRQSDICYLKSTGRPPFS